MKSSRQAPLVSPGTDAGPAGRTPTARELERPVLFHRVGLDWHWIARREAERRLAACAAGLVGLPPGARVGCPDRPGPEALLAERAIRASGRAAVPAAAEEPAPELVAWLDAGGPTPPGVPVIAPSDSGGAAPAWDLSAAWGAAVVRAPHAGERELTGATLVGWVEALDRRLGSGPGRDILVVRRSLREPTERLLVDWALAAGAAIVLAPEADAAQPVILWSRPTVLHATATELAALVRRVVDHHGRPRRAWRRLRAIVVVGEESLDPEADRLWRRLVGRVVALTGPLPADAVAVV